LKGFYHTSKPWRCLAEAFNNAASDFTSPLFKSYGESRDALKLFAIYKTNAGQSISNATLTIVDFEDVEVDTHTTVTVGVAWKFIAPRSGFYECKATILWANAAWTATTTVEFYLYKNNAIQSTFNFHEVEASQTMLITLMGSRLLYLNAGDFIDFRLLHNQGTARSLSTSAADNFATIEYRGNL
jgi:hypothetical protein